MFGLSAAEGIQIIQCLILLGTAFIVWHYTWETKKLREATQKQTDQMIQPVFFLSLQKYGPPDIYIKNISNNPALNVYFEPMLIKEPDEYVKHYKPIPLLSTNEEPEKLVLYREKQGEYKNGAPFTKKDPLAKGEESLNLSITFQNGAMQKFRLHGILSMDKFELKKLEEIK